LNGAEGNLECPTRLAHATAHAKRGGGAEAAPGFYVPVMRR
jgi:hypothetical protein